MDRRHGAPAGQSGAASPWVIPARTNGLVTETIAMNAKTVILSCAAIALAAPASAQVELKTYADSNGYVDVQKLTCAQLANTFQEDADYLTAWYSGWYNGLAKKHAMRVDRAKALEHELIVHCKANPGKKVIQAIDIVFKEYRAKAGIKMN
jgi:hypothetical protein